MKVKLLRDSRPYGRTGEILDVSPELADFLLSLGMAEPVAEAREQAPEPKAEKAVTPKKTSKKK